MARSYIVESKNIKFLLFYVFIICWSSKVLGEQDYYPEIHKIWPSLRMSNLTLLRATADEEEDMNKNQQMVMSPSASSFSPQKTVVFPSPICISIFGAPCFMVQIDWRGSKSQLLGVVKDTIKNIPNLPNPQGDKPMSKSHILNLFTNRLRNSDY